MVIFVCCFSTVINRHHRFAIRIFVSSCRVRVRTLHVYYCLCLVSVYVPGLLHFFNLETIESLFLWKFDVYYYILSFWFCFVLNLFNLRKDSRCSDSSTEWNFKFIENRFESVFKRIMYVHGFLNWFSGSFHCIITLNKYWNSILWNYAVWILYFSRITRVIVRP